MSETGHSLPRERSPPYVEHRSVPLWSLSGSDVCKQCRGEKIMQVTNCRSKQQTSFHFQNDFQKKRFPKKKISKKKISKKKISKKKDFQKKRFPKRFPKENSKQFRKGPRGRSLNPLFLKGHMCISPPPPQQGRVPRRWKHKCPYLF